MTTAVTISERAARRIGEILKGEGDGAMLRISVEGGGCSGFQYKFDVDHAKAEDDLVIERDSAVVLVFVDQTTSSPQKKDPEKTQSAVLVTLKKVAGSWLIAKFDPTT